MVLISRSCSSQDTPLDPVLPPGSSLRSDASTGILPYTWRSHWDPPLESTFPPGSSPTPGALTGIFPWTQRSNQDPSLGPIACENIRFSSPYVPSGEERGETDVFVGYRPNAPTGILPVAPVPLQDPPLVPIPPGIFP